MPLRPRNACPICRRVGCPGHTPKQGQGTGQGQGKGRVRRPHTNPPAHKVSHAERKYRKLTVERWIREHGYVCPGYQRPSHDARDLTADHVHPLHAGGDPFGPLVVLCNACNARRGNDTRWALRAGRERAAGVQRKS